jgi:anion-transporting  ArsA/GET3 family ATPase
MEQLHRIYQAGSYDLIVVDTPPARHALEFLDAPRRLIGFLDAQLLRLLFRPAVAMGRTGFRLFRLGSATVLRTIERITGLEFLRMIGEFLLAFEGMLDGFLERAKETERLLRSEECGFLLVAGPDPAQARLATSFSERLSSEGIALLGLIANRARTWPAGPDAPDLSEDALAEDDAPFDPRATASVLIGTAARQARLARQDRETLAALLEELPVDEGQTRTIPLLSEDVHALEALVRMARFVFPENGNGA